MAPPPLSLRALNRATLARQHLLGRAKISPLALVEDVAGLQAQLARPPFIGLFSRLEAFKREDLHARVIDRKIVRATAMRGTLHLMSAQDYLALRTALQPMLSRGMQSALKERSTSFELAEVMAIAREFFAQPQTFDALRDRLVERFPDGDERAMAYAVRMQLPLVQVPSESEWSFPGTAAFTLAETWLGQAPSPESRAHELILRYLRAFGPASVADAQTWSGLQGLKPTFEELRPRLLTFQDENGKELFDLPDAPRPAEDTLAPVRFLPDFDNLVLAHADRSRVIADAHRPLIATKNLQVLPTFLVDGRVAGSWKLDAKRSLATLSLTSFVALSEAEREALAEEGEKLLGFVAPDSKRHALQFA